jgi:diguanylate cyclase (GGDEF)-like protein
MKRSVLSGSDLSCAVIDLDHFKHITDTYGHDGGEIALRRVIAVCRKHLRDSDYVARTGGDELTIIMRDMPLAAATDAAERLRIDVENTPVSAGAHEFDISVSIGVAQRLPCDRTTSDFLQAADAAMYVAKSLGRNRTICSRYRGRTADFHEIDPAVLLDRLPAQRYATVDIYEDQPADRSQHLDYLAGARKCFHHAKHHVNERMRALFADIALDYLKLAHEQALIVAAWRTKPDEAAKAQSMRVTHL